MSSDSSRTCPRHAPAKSCGVCSATSLVVKKRPAIPRHWKTILCWLSYASKKKSEPHEIAPQNSGMVWASRRACLSGRGRQDKSTRSLSPCDAHRFVSRVNITSFFPLLPVWCLGRVRRWWYFQNLHLLWSVTKVIRLLRLNV